MTCPRCSVSEISPLTGKCDLCGFAPAAAVVVESVDAVAELARRQIEHEFEFKGLVGRRDGTTVQRVVERSSGRTLILKVIVRRSADRDAEEWFRVTMNALSGFDHPNLTRVLRYGSTDSIFWFAAEDHGTISLAERLRENGPMDLRATRRLLTQVAGALEYLHRRALVHGALKASNVLVDHDGWLRLADVSLTRPAPPPVPAPGSPSAPRPSWVAPEEHSRGERLPAADQYALGALAFECLTGAMPGSSNDAAAHLRADVPPRLVLAIERALDDDPTRRFPTCSDFLWALEEDIPRRASQTPTMLVAAPAPEARSTPGEPPASNARPTRAVPAAVPVAVPVAVPAAVLAGAATRPTQEVVMIRDWEPAPDPRRTMIRALRIGAGIVAVVALLVAIPSLSAIIWPEPTPAPARTSAASPVNPPAALPPSATTKAQSPSELRSEPRGTTPTEPRTEPRVAAQRASQPASTAPARSPARSPARPPARPPASVPRAPARTPSTAAPAAAPAAAPTAAPAVAPAAAPAAGGAKLFINSNPWGQLTIDGAAVGNTPRANIDLTSGSHVLRIIRAGYVTWERTVRVAAGETLRITDIVLVPTPP